MDVDSSLVFVEDLACAWRNAGICLFVEPVRQLH
jgi:hypothetical protein